MHSFMMSDDNNLQQEKPFYVEIAKGSKAVCKKCKEKCVQGKLRIAKSVPHTSGTDKSKAWHWYHVDCIFEVFLKQRSTTKRIEGSNDVEGWDMLSEEHKEYLSQKIMDCYTVIETNKLHKSLKSISKRNSRAKSQANVVKDCLNITSDNAIKETAVGGLRDIYFSEFRKLVGKVASEKETNEKIKLFREFFAKGSDGISFKGDKFLWCKLLLPEVKKRDYHLHTKQLMKLFTRLFRINEEISVELEKNNLNNLGETIKILFEKSKDVKPAERSCLTLQEVDDFLELLTTITNEEEQYKHFKTLLNRCTCLDLKVIIRLIIHDLRMNAGTKHVLKGLHPNAYSKFQTCGDLKTVLRWINENPETDPGKSRKNPKRKALNFTTDSQKKMKIESLIQAKKNDIKLKEVKEKRKPMLNFFHDVKMYLENGVAEVHSEWIRYFIDYGGTVLGSSEIDKATHALHLNDTITEPTLNSINSTRHVIVEWIKHTVEKKELLDCRPYTVRWKPDICIN